MARSVKGKGGKQKATKRQSSEKISKKELEMIKALEEKNDGLFDYTATDAVTCSR